jgi:hypothetical protein
MFKYEQTVQSVTGVKLNFDRSQSQEAGSECLKEGHGEYCSEIARPSPKIALGKKSFLYYTPFNQLN